MWWSPDGGPDAVLLYPGLVSLKVSSQGVGCTLVGEGKEERCWDEKRRRVKVETEIERRT